MRFISLQLSPAQTIQLSPEQVSFLGWCNSHYKQLQAIANSGALDISSSSFTVHLKPAIDAAVPLIGKIEMHKNYLPKTYE